jgi:hypothetical protein
MAGPAWTDVVQAIGAILTPIVVAGLAYSFTRSQSRSDELLKVRLDYYKLVAPDLNRLMCYMTFIGTWRDQSPVDVINLKRRIDQNFYCAAPLFSPQVMSAYEALMNLSFATFSDWGSDARLLSNAYRRRQAWRATAAWDPKWDRYFAMDDATTISARDLRNYRDAYDSLIASLVRDLDINRARARYTTDQVSLNAHAPRREDITGHVA